MIPSNHSRSLSFWRLILASLPFRDLWTATVSTSRNYAAAVRTLNTIISIVVYLLTIFYISLTYLVHSA